MRQLFGGCFWPSTIFGGCQWNQSRFGLSLLVRASVNQGCWSEQWLMTRSSVTVSCARMTYESVAVLYQRGP